MQHMLTILAMGFFMLFSTLPVMAAENITIKFDDIPFYTTRYVYTANGRTMIPLRDIFEAIGARVSWDPKTKTVSAKRGTADILLTIGSTIAKRGQKTVKLDTAPVIRSGFTYVPLRFVTESFGATVDWDAKTQTVIIKDDQTAKWLQKAKAIGRPLYWKIADVNNDSRNEFMVLLETISVRRFLVFNTEQQIFSADMTNPVNEISIIDLDANTKGVSVHQAGKSGLTNVNIFIITTGVKELGSIGAGSGNVTFISDSPGKTEIVENTGDSQSTWEYNGSELVETSDDTTSSGTTSSGNSGSNSTPVKPAEPSEVAYVGSVSQSFFEVLLSGDLEEAKAFSAAPNDANTAAYIQKSIDDLNSFISKHTGTAWTPSNGAVLSGNRADYYKWINFPDAKGYLAITMKKINDRWVVTNAEFKNVPN